MASALCTKRLQWYTYHKQGDSLINSERRREYKPAYDDQLKNFNTVPLSIYTLVLQYWCHDGMNWQIKRISIKDSLLSYIGKLLYTTWHACNGSIQTLTISLAISYTFFHLIPATTRTPTPETTPMQADISTRKSMAKFVAWGYCFHMWQLGLQNI